MIIRQATKADLPKINELIRQNDDRFLKEQMLEDIKDPLNISLVAEQEETEKQTILAFGQARQVKATETDPKADTLVRTVFVARDQERIIAAQFMEQWLLEAKKRKIKRVDFNGF